MKKLKNAFKKWLKNLEKSSLFTPTGMLPIK